MNRLGHLGLTLLVFSPLSKVLGVDFVITASLLGLLPDIDLAVRLRHREYTHNFTFAALMALLVSRINAKLALATFASISLHVLADLLTMQKFPPLYPFSRKRYALKLFRSNDPTLNFTLFILGIFAFIRFAGWWA